MLMNKVIKRDNQLDIYRGISMIYVVCFIHVLFWFHIGKEPYISIALIEMPVIFYISGASLSLSNGNKNLCETFMNRFKRVIFPYYIYAFVVLMLIAFFTLIRSGLFSCYDYYCRLDFIDKYYFDITAYTLNDVVNVLFCVNIPQSPFSTHLWFILPYMIIYCSFVFQSIILKKIDRWPYAVFCLILCVVTQLLTDNIIIREVVFYNVFFIFGYLFYRQISEKLIVVAGLVFLLSIILYIKFGGMFTSMQSHKFPPDMLFVGYGLTFICFISLLLGHVKLPKIKVIQLWNNRGYTIYLYQNLIYFVVNESLLSYIKIIQFDLIQLIICSTVIFLLSTLLSFISYRFERFVVSHIS